MKVKTRIFLATGGLVVLLLATSLYCVNRLQASLVVFQADVQKAHRESDMASSMLVDFKVQVQEWKDVLLRGSDPQKLETYWGNFQKQEARVEKTGQELLQSLAGGDARQLVEQFLRQHQLMGENYRKGMQAFRESGFDFRAGDQAVAGMDREPAKLLLQFKEMLAGSSQSAADEASLAAGQAVRTSLIVVGAIALVAVAVAFGLSTSVIRPLESSLATVRRVADGDLREVVVVDRQDEFGHLLAELHRMRRQLAELVGMVRSGSESVATASAEIAQGNQDLSQRTESQASALQETAASMEELGSTTRLNAEHARHASGMTQGASAVAKKDGAVVSDVVETMRSINESSRKIADIIAVIDGIAFQTNILALNAAIGFDSAQASLLGQQSSVFGQGLLGLRWRLFDFKRIDAEIAAARGQQQESLVAYRATILRAAADVEDSFGDVLRNRERLAELVGQQALAHRRLATVRRAWQAGASSRDDTLGAEQEALRLDTLVNGARRDVALAVVGASRSLGQVPQP